MKKYLIITADSCDKDYVTSRKLITDKELELIKPVIDDIRNFVPYVGTKPEYWKHKHTRNYPKGDCDRIPLLDLGEKSAKDLYGHNDGFEIFDRFVPFGVYGTHTIKSIELLIVQDEIKLL